MSADDSSVAVKSLFCSIYGFLHLFIGRECQSLRRPLIAFLASRFILLWLFLSIETLATDLPATTFPRLLSGDLSPLNLANASVQCFNSQAFCAPIIPAPCSMR